LLVTRGLEIRDTAGWKRALRTGQGQKIRKGDQRQADSRRDLPPFRAASQHCLPVNCPVTALSLSWIETSAINRDAIFTFGSQEFHCPQRAAQFVLTACTRLGAATFLKLSDCCKTT
jgi:hypothetical protein